MSMTKRYKEFDRIKRRERGWWQVTTINPHAPELGRIVTAKRMLESSAVRKAGKINAHSPGYQAKAEPMRSGREGEK